MRKHKQGGKDILDHTNTLGHMVISAYKSGGMPLVFAVVGVVCLVLSFGLIIIKYPILWICIFASIGVISLCGALYLYLKKKPAETCPKCGRELIVKQKFGKFLACPGYPHCRYTKNID